MRIIATMKAFNEEDFIYYVLKSIEPYVDQIVIVEGCTKAMADNIIPKSLDGLSTDNTAEEIQRFISETSKPVTFNRMKFVVDEIPLWNQMLADAKPEVGDIIWMVDADEYYEPESAEGIISAVTKNPHVLSWKIPMIMFWHDFHHIIKGGIWSHVAHERIIRIPVKGCHYVYKSDLIKPNKIAVADGGKGFYEKDMYRAEIADFAILHFAYARSAKKIVEKQVWQLVEYERWGSPNAKHQFGPQEKLKWGRAADYIVRNFCWFTNVFDDRESHVRPDDPIRVVGWPTPLEGPITDHPFCKDLRWDKEEMFYEYPRETS